VYYCLEQTTLSGNNDESYSLKAIHGYKLRKCQLLRKAGTKSMHISSIDTVDTDGSIDTVDSSVRIARRVRAIRTIRSARIVRANLGLVATPLNQLDLTNLTYTRLTAPSVTSPALPHVQQKPQKTTLCPPRAHSQ
jgi:hypothetical protein